MPLMREKRISFAGFELGLALEERQAERIRNSWPYRYLVRPGLRLVQGRGREPQTCSEIPPPIVGRPLGPVDGAAGELWQRVSRIGWYHTIDLGNGVVTPGFVDNRSTVHLYGLPEDLSGKRCLDIGTYDGFWAFEMERRGASEVIGIDVDSPSDHDIPRRLRESFLTEGDPEEVLRRRWEEQLAQLGLQFPGEGFRLAREVLGSRVRRETLNVYDLSSERLGRFDLVLISQLLLRLRDPQTALENIFSVTRGVAIVAEPFDPDLESLGRPLSEFVGTTSMGIWWRHNIKALRKMMEVAGFHPVEEVSRFIAENRVGRFWKVVLKGYAPAG